MRMQAIPVQQQPGGIQTPQPVYAPSVASSPSGSYHEYEFVDQTTPTPPAGQFVGYQQQPQQQSVATFAPVEGEQKAGYPEVPSVRSGVRLVRVVRPPPSVPVAAERPERRSWSQGLLVFFRNLFKDEETETVAQAIAEESQRQVEVEESIENEQERIDRQERQQAWERIAQLGVAEAQVAAIQAEISRSENHCRRTSERRAERARQRDNAREELSRYRSQRAKVQVLRALSYSVTAYLVFSTIWSVGKDVKCCGPIKSGSGQRVLVAKSNSNPPQQAPPTAPPAAAQQAQAPPRRCGW